MADKKLAKLVVRLEAENGKLHRELDKSERKVKNFSSKTKKSLKDVQISFGALAGVAAAGLAFRAVTRASIEQENALRQLDARLKSTGGAAGLTAEEVSGMAASLQDVTTFGDEAIIGMQNLLLTFTSIKKGDDVFEDTTKIILDMSVAMGQDLKSSALQVGKALNDPVVGLTALSRVGVKFTDDQKDLIKSLTETGDVAGAQKIILKELQTEFGGAAVAARDTFGGALTSLKNAFGDLLESDNLGESTKQIEGLTKILQDPKTKAGFETFTSGIISIAGAAAKGISDLASFAKTIGEIAAGAKGFGADVDAIENEIADLESTISSLQNRNKFLGLFVNTEENDRIIKESKARIEQLKREEAAIFDARGRSLYDQAESSPQASVAQPTTGLGTGGGLSESKRSALEKELEAVEQFSLTELERLEAANERRQEIINTSLENKLLSEEAAQGLRLALEEKFQAQLSEIEKKGLTDREKFERLSLKAKAKTVFGMLANITAGVANENKALFRINQIAGIANASISTYEGVAAALKLGPIIGPPLAAITLAAGLAQVAAIKSQSFGGGSSAGGSLAPSFAGTGVTNVVSIADQQTEQPTPQQVSITINSGIYDASAVRELIETINDEVGDGVALRVDVA